MHHGRSKADIDLSGGLDKPAAESLDRLFAGRDEGLEGAAERDEQDSPMTSEVVWRARPSEFGGDV